LLEEEEERGRRMADCGPLLLFCPTPSYLLTHSVRALFSNSILVLASRRIILPLTMVPLVLPICKLFCRSLGGQPSLRGNRSLLYTFCPVFRWLKPPAFPRYVSSSALPSFLLKRS